MYRLDRSELNNLYIYCDPNDEERLTLLNNIMSEWDIAEEKAEKMLLHLEISDEIAKKILS